RARLRLVDLRLLGGIDRRPRTRRGTMDLEADALELGGDLRVTALVLALVVFGFGFAPLGRVAAVLRFLIFLLFFIFLFFIRVLLRVLALFGLGAALLLLAVKSVGHLVGDRVGLQLGRLARIRDLLGFVALVLVGLALHARLLPLHDVRQLVR